jgi:lipopolysaccharide export system permease protein
MMLMLPLLAVALAVPPKRSSSALGIFVGDRDGGRPITRSTNMPSSAGAQGRLDPRAGAVAAAPPVLRR